MLSLDETAGVVIFSGTYQFACFFVKIENIFKGIFLENEYEAIEIRVKK